MKLLKIGTRVVVGGELSHWTDTAKQNLPGVEGVIEQYKADYDFDCRPAYLVRLDTPVKVNPVSEFTSAWLSPDDLHELLTPKGGAE